MKPDSVILLVQGEGRGHMTQAMAIADILRKKGIQIKYVLVGVSSARTLPVFFLQAFSEPVEILISPGFTKKNGRGNHIWKTIFNTILAIPKYIRSLRQLHSVVRTHKPSLLIGFYEPLFAFYNLFFRSRAVKIAIAHQYEYLHEAYVKPAVAPYAYAVLKYYSRFTCYGASQILAISLQELPRSVKYPRLRVIPPLLRKELFDVVPSVQPFLLLYVVNPGYIKDIERWHTEHPEVVMHCFTDGSLVASREKGTWEVDETLTFHALDGRKFLDFLAACSGVCCTAGFETVAEALWLGKPVLLIPVEGHIEQRCNALQAARLGVASWSDHLDPGKLKNLTALFAVDHSAYREWVASSERRFMEVIAFILNPAV
jgi:uncharacterized protein (TIGR00661 family)